MEMGEEFETFLDNKLNGLEMLKNLWFNKRWESTIEAMALELRLLKMLLLGLDYWEERKNFRHLQSAMHNMMPELSRMVRRFRTECKRCIGNDDDNQHRLMLAVAFDFHETIKGHLRPQARKFCITFLGAADHKCLSCPTNHKMFVKYVKDTTSFIEFLKQILDALLNSDLNIAPVMKQHISTIGSGIENFRVNVDSPTRLFDLIPCARAWLNRVSCLTYLYWIDRSVGSLASTIETMVSDLLPKSLPVGTSGVISSYFQPQMIPQLLATHLDFILDNLDAPMGVDTEMLREGLIFLLSFVLDALEDDSVDRGMIWTQMFALINKFPFLVYSMENFSDMLLRISTLKEKVTKLYLATPYLSQSWSSNTNAMGFLDSLVGNLKKLKERELNPIPSVKHLWELLFTELDSLKPFLKNIMEGDETQNLCRELKGMVHNADYLIRICHLRSFSAWYGIVALPYVIECLKCKKMEISDHNSKKLGHCDQMEVTVPLRPRGTNSEIEKFFISFVEDERVIYNELMRGLKALTIISISGSGGQGKTTFAKRMYNDPNVQCHFQKTVWCYVSKDCPVKELLAQILSKSDNNVGNGSEMQDLIEHVRKSLKGRRYLIVMDDIWGVDVWSKLESSFPNDNNGSRIMFTSRNHDLASQVKLNSVSRRLPLFSDEQSWELMKKSVFGAERCAEVFVEIGRKLASYCEGLPLAVVLIAAVLRRTERNLDSWEKVALSLKAHLTLEGCGNVIELSYTYLPDHLKSCFLYFGVFQRAEEVRAKKLKLLWMGEGFVNQDGEADLATKYLKDLVSQGLVTVIERSSTGGIKSCNVHDLLYDLCLEKCKENDFFHWVEKSTVVISSIAPLKYGHQRLRIGVGDSFIHSNPLVTKRDLLTSSLHTFLWLDDGNSDRRMKYPLKCLESFKILTVLKLRLHFYIEEFPQVVLSCVCLTYLELGLGKRIKVVPPAIANLWKLQTLIIDGLADPGVTLLPVTLLDMESLKHVHVEMSRFLWGVDEKNSKYASNIETLGYLDLYEDDSTDTKFLQNFPKLRKLSCTGHIFKWLSMVGSLSTQLEFLKVTHWGYFYSNPVVCNISDFQNLSKLTLEKFRVRLGYVLKIGKQLPNLCVLKLSCFFNEGRRWKLKDGDFSKLMHLKLCLFHDIEEIDVSRCEDSPPFPCLEHLVLEYCEKLKEIPLVFGEICSLKKIHVIGCNAKVTASAMKILDQQRDVGNHIFQVMVEKEEEEGQEDGNEDEDLGRLRQF